jgi:hypothetical protein
VKASPIFGAVGIKAGMYESFYLRAFAPERPVGLWIRHTVHKRPGMAPTASIWCTVFDTRRGAPLMAKATSAELEMPPGGWISVGGQATFGPGWAEGSCGEASWSLRFTTTEPPPRHLSPDWLYRTPLPRTKLTSPAPAARFSGSLTLAGAEPITLEGWPGMVGHNWGSEHAERWIWLHGAGFAEAPEAWLDLALGRILIGRRLTPWVANGALSLDGIRHRIGGLRGSRPQVQESVSGCSIRLSGRDGLELALRARTPPGQAAGWRYADPDGGEHDVVNCSIAQLELDLLAAGRPRRSLSSAHGGAYELGMRARDHGIPIAPFPDG